MRDQHLNDIFDGNVPPSNADERALLDMKSALRQQYHASGAPQLTSDDLLRELRTKPAPAAPRFRWVWAAPVAAAALAVWFFNASNIQSPTADPNPTDIPAVAMDTPDNSDPTDEIATELTPEPTVQPEVQTEPQPEVQPEPAPVVTPSAPAKAPRSGTRRQTRPNQSRPANNSRTAPSQPADNTATRKVETAGLVAQGGGGSLAPGGAGNSFSADSAPAMAMAEPAPDKSPIVLVTDNPSRLAGVSVATELNQSDVVFGG